MAKTRVAVIAADGETRKVFAAYLRDAGFDVHVSAELDTATAFAGIVLIADTDEANSTLVATVRARIKASRTQRVVVVTSKPTALRDLVAAHGDRLAVLAAPVFCWHVVDALRNANPTKPRRTP